MSERVWTEEKVGTLFVRCSLSPENPLWMDYQIEDESVGPEGLARDVCARGFVKWDGCQEISEVDAVHFCTTPMVEEFGRALLVARRLASSLIEAWEGGDEGSGGHGGEEHDKAPLASGTVAGHAAEALRLPVAVSWRANEVEQRAILVALCKAHGFPEGVPFDTAVPEALKAAQERARHGFLSVRLEAVLIVDADGSVRVEHATTPRA